MRPGMLFSLHLALSHSSAHPTSSCTQSRLGTLGGMDHYPPFAYSMFDRPDGAGRFGYKVLGKDKANTPFVLVHG